MSHVTKNIINYIGQLRIYSLADLVLLLIALRPTGNEFFGVLLLHVAFLAFLESRHAHLYRKKVPEAVWVILLVLGIIFYRHLTVLGYVAASYIYTKKSNRHFGIFSPFARALQYLFIVAGIIGVHHPFVWLVTIAIFARNLAGDFRDAGKDASENMKTLPVLLGFKRNMPYVHIIALLVTTAIWWTFSGLNPLWLLLFVIIEIGTYNLTPR